MRIFGSLEYDHLHQLLAAPADETIVISSSGGSLSVATAICDVLRVAPRPILALGENCSAAIPIIAMGAPRVCGAATRFLWHQAFMDSYEGSATAKELSQVSHELKLWWEWANRVLGQVTEKDAEFWTNLGREEGEWFSSGAAIEWGLVEAWVEPGQLPPPEILGAPPAESLSPPDEQRPCDSE
jgi:ATP-dependent protease ClpP protease subunit